MRRQALIRSGKPRVALMDICFTEVAYKNKTKQTKNKGIFQVSEKYIYILDTRKVNPHFPRSENRLQASS